MAVGDFTNYNRMREQPEIRRVPFRIESHTNSTMKESERETFASFLILTHRTANNKRDPITYAVVESRRLKKRVIIFYMGQMFSRVSHMRNMSNLSSNGFVPQFCGLTEKYVPPTARLLLHEHTHNDMENKRVSKSERMTEEKQYLLRGWNRMNSCSIRAVPGETADKRNQRRMRSDTEHNRKAALL
ncbi:hypothetical protein CBL_04621 [Carabus blaptoides fortunei]